MNETEDQLRYIESQTLIQKYNINGYNTGSVEQEE